MKQKISVVIPVKDEEENIKELYDELSVVLKHKTGCSYEIIFVDDGSTDNSYDEIKKINDEFVKVIKFRRNYGQTAAMDAGFKVAKGDIIIPMDADLQNDPGDIPKLLEKLGDGWDVVSGWRKNRKDSITKKFVSKGANMLRKILFKDSIHDSGCTLKAYRKESLKGLSLYGEMHRFIPAILVQNGFRVTEIPVNHRERRYGKTKYGVGRMLRGFLDMMVVKFWMTYSTRPMHIFGALGVASGFLGGVVMFYLAYIRLVLGGAIGNKPLLPLGVLLVLLGVQFITFGLVADMLMKVYYKDRENYKVEEQT